MQNSCWLDTVLAVPAIGLLTEQRVDFPALVWTLLAKMQASWRSDELGESTINAVSPTDVRIQRDGGLYMNLTPSGIVTGYTFNMKLKSKPGGLPALEEIELASYTTLQSTAFRLMKDFFEIAFGQDVTYPVLRIGVLAQTRLVAADSPPGIMHYLESLGQVVGGSLIASEGNLIGRISTRDGSHDQCHHVCKVNNIDRPDDLEFGLDYQRTWRPMKSMTPSTLRDELGSVVKAANLYFETFGSGVRDHGDTASNCE